MSTDDPNPSDLPPAVRETLDSLGGALGDIAELDKEQLSETIGLLETLGHDQAAGILHSRREVLKGAGAATGLGIAGLAGASATGTASAGNDQAGTVGSQAAPLDGYVEDLYDKNGNRVAELPGDGSLDVLQELSSQSVSTDSLNNGGPISDGDGTERQIWVIANGASDPSGADPEDIIFEEEA